MVVLYATSQRPEYLRSNNTIGLTIDIVKTSTHCSPRTAEMGKLSNLLKAVSGELHGALWKGQLIMLRGAHQYFWRDLYSCHWSSQPHRCPSLQEQAGRIFICPKHVDEFANHWHRLIYDHFVVKPGSRKCAAYHAVLDNATPAKINCRLPA